jgi:hypothetical protein
VGCGDRRLKGEEIAQRGALARVDEHHVGCTRLRHAQGQGGVEVARLEEEQRVHGGSAMVPHLGSNLGRGLDDA